MATALMHRSSLAYAMRNVNKSVKGAICGINNKQTLSAVFFCLQLELGCIQPLSSLSKRPDMLADNKELLLLHSSIQCQRYAVAVKAHGKL